MGSSSAVEAALHQLRAAGSELDAKIAEKRKELTELERQRDKLTAGAAAFATDTRTPDRSERVGLASVD